MTSKHEMPLIHDLSELLKALERGDLREHRYPNVELKQSWKQDVGKKISAHANNLNAEKGWVVLGVDDDGKVCGKDKNWLEKTERQISDHLNLYLDPAQAFEGLSCVENNAGSVIVLRVSSPGAVTFWNKQPYKLAGTTCAVMEPEEVMEWTIRLPGLQDYSKQAWDGTVDLSLVGIFAKAIASRYPKSELAGLATLDASQVLQRLGIPNTNVARILFGDCRFRVVLYDANHNPISNENYIGLARLLFPDVHTSMLFPQHTRNLPTKHLPEKALSEAIANAVAHSAYFERDGEIIIEVFPDQIWISNLCLQESTYFANKWFSRSRNTVNPMLMETLRLAGIVDELGRGKNLIYRDSIIHGLKPPIVEVEKAGRLSRWRLLLYGGPSDQKLVALRARLKERYHDDQKALIACALVLWRDKKVSEIQQYIDTESAERVAEVLSDLHGPVFYFADEDRLVLNRWAALLIGEGKDSKKFSEAEERRVHDLTYKICTKHYDGVITPKILRSLGELGESNAARTISSALLKKWETERKVRRLGKGRYKFEPRVTQDDFKNVLTLLMRAVDKSSNPSTHQ